MYKIAYLARLKNLICVVSPCVQCRDEVHKQGVAYKNKRGMGFEINMINNPYVAFLTHPYGLLITNRIQTLKTNYIVPGTS